MGHPPVQESQATKRKRELDEQGKRKRSKQDKATKQRLSEATAGNANANADNSNSSTTNDAQSRPLEEGAVIKVKRNPRPKRKGQAALEQYASSAWKVSQPMGGRILNIDPLLTKDERCVSCFF